MNLPNFFHRLLGLPGHIGRNLRGLCGQFIDLDPHKGYLCNDRLAEVLTVICIAQEGSWRRKFSLWRGCTAARQGLLA